MAFENSFLDDGQEQWNEHYSYIETKEHLGLALREVRKKRNLSQKEVAKLINIDVKTLRKIEQGSGSYSIDKLFSLLCLYKHRLSTLKEVRAATTLDILNSLEELYN